MVRCGFHALNVANLKAVVKVLQRAYSKIYSLLNLIIFVTARQFHLFLTLCSQLRFTKVNKNEFEPERRLQRCKVSSQSCFDHKITYLTIGTNKFPKVLSDLPQTLISFYRTKSSFPSNRQHFQLKLTKILVSSPLLSTYSLGALKSHL